MVAVSLAAGCFGDVPPQLGCAGDPAACAAETTGADTNPDASTGPPATTAETTGTPVDNSRAFRIELLEIIDPHLFLEMPICMDVTDPINQQGIAGQIMEGKFNLIVYFEDFDELEPQLKEVASCDLEAMRCVDKSDVALQVPAMLDEVGPCSALSPEVVQAANLAGLHAPAPPCYRTESANIALPIEGAEVPLNLREAQIVFNLDDPTEPQEVQNGLLYGFLTQASAEATTISLLNFDFPLWPMMSPSNTCAELYPDQLPSVDVLMDGETMLPGVWMAVNFSARRIELDPPPP